MKAFVQGRYGSALALEDVDRPTPKDDEVLVRVRAAGVDPGVWHLMAGLPYLVRLGYGLRKPKTPIPGMDLAGVVEAVGKSVTALKPGDEVFGTCKGSFAEYACAPADGLGIKPANLTFEQAAVVPISGYTALQALRDSAKVQPGQTVLIIGAAGGVGVFAVQIAKAYGAEVTGVCSTSKTDLVRSLGADHVIDYTREDFAAGDKRYDVILDTAGRRSLPQLRRALAPAGSLVIVGGEGGGKITGGFGRNLRAVILSAFMRQKLISLLSKENGKDLVPLKDMIEAGKVTPVIDRTYPLEEAPAAIDYVAQGHARGKVVLTI